MFTGGVAYVVFEEATIAGAYGFFGGAVVLEGCAGLETPFEEIPLAGCAGEDEIIGAYLLGLGELVILGVPGAEDLDTLRLPNFGGGAIACEACGLFGG